MKIRAILAIIALILIPTLFTAASGLVPKRYTAVAKLLISAPSMGRYDNGPMQALDDISNFSAARTAKTQIDVITGTDVLREAILATQKKFPTKFPPGRSINQQFEEISRRLAVDSDGDSDVLYIRIANEDPELAAEYANQIGYSYIGFARNLSIESASAALTAMRKQIAASKKRLTEIDLEEAQLKQGADTPDVAASAAATSSDLVQTTSRYTEFKGLYEGTLVELARAKAELANIPPRIVNGTRVEINPVLTQLQLQEVGVQTELAELRARYQDDFPDVVVAKRKLADLRASMRKMSRTMAGGTDMIPNQLYNQQLLTISQLEGRVGSLREQLAAAKSRVDSRSERTKDVTDIQRKMASLQREKVVLEQNYLQIEQRRDITETMGSARQSSARLVSPAFVPSAPSFPDPRIFTLAGLAIGVFTAVLLLMPRASDTVITTRTVDDLSNDELAPTEPSSRLEAGRPADPDDSIVPRDKE